LIVKNLFMTDYDNRRARACRGRKREAEADAAFRTVKIVRSVGSDIGRKAHDKERQVIEKTKSRANNKKRRARYISLRAENLQEAVCPA
jgi:hypothetical protein